MINVLKTDIYHDGEFYCARCLDMNVFTQGKTLDETVHNLKEAIQLHLEDIEHLALALDNFRRAG